MCLRNWSALYIHMYLRARLLRNPERGPRPELGQFARTAAATRVHHTYLQLAARALARAPHARGYVYADKILQKLAVAGVEDVWR